MFNRVQRWFVLLCMLMRLRATTNSGFHQQQLNAVASLSWLLLSVVEALAVSVKAVVSHAVCRLCTMLLCRLC
jgi:hypothetical protein